jgi:hypothetical protein
MVLKYVVCHFLLIQEVPPIKDEEHIIFQLLVSTK